LRLGNKIGPRNLREWIVRGSARDWIGDGLGSMKNLNAKIKEMDED